MISGVSWLLKPPTIICCCQFPLLCLLPFILCIEVLLCWMHKYLQLLCLLLGWSLDHFIVSFSVYCFILYFKVYFIYENCYTAFFKISICMGSLTFSLYVSLGLKWVSCRQHIYGSEFCIHSVSLYLWLVHLIHLH